MGVQLKFFPNSRPFEIEELQNATTGADGAMSKEDKAKLNGIPTGGGGSSGAARWRCASPPASTTARACA